MKGIIKEWPSILSIVVSGVCFWLGDIQAIPKDSIPPNPFRFLNAESYNNIPEYKNIIVLIVIIIFVIILVAHAYHAECERKKWLKSFLKHLTNQHLSGGNYNTRITIFTLRRGWRFLLPHLWAFIWDSNHPYSMVPNPFKKYLAIYVRYTSLKQPKSFTFFRIDNNSKKHSKSLVAECFKTGEKITGRTSTIKDIDLPSDRNKLYGEKKKRVDRYMKDTLIEDYDTLLTINSPSNSILALPIIHSTERWGVIVFDHFSEPGDPVIDFESKITDEFLYSYQKIIQFTTYQIE